VPVAAQFGPDRLRLTVTASGAYIESSRQRALPLNTVDICGSGTVTAGRSSIVHHLIPAFGFTISFEHATRR
jgi:hypothetical protein